MQPGADRACTKAILTRPADYLNECLVLVPKIESAEVEGECELLLGEVEFDADQLQAASEHFARSLTVCRAGANTRGEANAQWRLGAMDLARGDYALARSRLGEAVRAFHSTEMWKGVLGCLEDFVALAQAAGSYEEAVRIAAAATLARQRLGLVRRPAAAAALASQAGCAARALWRRSIRCRMERGMGQLGDGRCGLVCVGAAIDH